MSGLIKKIIFYCLEKFSRGFLTMHLRPKSAGRVNTQSDPVKNSPRLGLIIQGPLVKKDNFTLESVKLYQKHFAETIFILSTWKDEAEVYLKKFRELGIEVILNEKPAYAGAGNINYQIVSTAAGIKRAQELNCQYVLKTRSDQRMYAPNIKEFLLNIVAAFPLKSGYRQRERLVGVSLNTFKYRPYGLSDMTMFGCLEDMWLYWGEVTLDQRPIITGITENTCRVFYDLRICEMYLLTEFLTAIGRPVANTIEDSWRVFAEHLCVVDRESLDLYWPKYNLHQEYRRLNYEAIKNCQVMNFREWFNLYQGLNNKAYFPESALNEPFDGPIKIYL